MAGETTTIDLRVSAGTDDAEERLSGAVNLTSSDLELVDENESSPNQTVGIRFNGLEIPQGAVVVNAYLQFQVDEKDSAETSLLIEGQDSDNATTFTTSSFDISSRGADRLLGRLGAGGMDDGRRGRPRPAHPGPVGDYPGDHRPARLAGHQFNGFRHHWIRRPNRRVL